MTVRNWGYLTVLVAVVGMVGCGGNPATPTAASPELIAKQNEEGAKMSGSYQKMMDQMKPGMTGPGGGQMPPGVEMPKMPNIPTGGGASGFTPPTGPGSAPAEQPAEKKSN